MNNFQLSGHFNLREFQCPCCKRVMVDERLIPVLEHIRAHFGMPVTVTSGYRCALHNQDCQGATESDHLHGWAADIVMTGIMPKDLADAARIYMPEGRIGTYKTKQCVHIGVEHRDGYPDRFHID